jgi:His/Glu/Gln/Arg/opine family amino acid ABC transporter permease subunit
MGIIIDSFFYLLSYLGNTVLLSIICIVLSTLIGLCLGILSVIGNKYIKILVLIYIFIIRGIPLLVHIFMSFYALPFIGIHAPPFVAAFLSISIYASAYISEIVRGGIQSVSKGQTEAGRALGFQEWAIIKRIILPQAIRYGIPPYTTILGLIIKGTSLASLITVSELTLGGKEIIGRTFLPFHVMGLTLFIYFALCYPLAYLGTRIEKQITYAQ